MHTADNDCIVRLSHAALALLYAIVQREFADLFLLRNNIINISRVMDNDRKCVQFQMFHSEHVRAFVSW